jgi:hypothetical protein
MAEQAARNLKESGPGAAADPRDAMGPARLAKPCEYCILRHLYKRMDTSLSTP